MDGTTTRRFNRREFAALLLGAMAAGRSGYAVAAVSPAEGYVSRIADEVMALANSGSSGNALRNKFAALLNRYINLRRVATIALGPYQKKISANEKSELYQLFNNYAAALFVYYVKEFQGNDMKVISSMKQGNFLTLDTALILKSGGQSKIKWRLEPSGSGYKVFDINVRNVWLTIATKKRFNDVLNKSKGDFEALFAELREAETW
ncbi:MAG: ABC transporter substrate-binding protein [Aestuariivirga sp.]